MAYIWACKLQARACINPAVASMRHAVDMWQARGGCGFTLIACDERKASSLAGVAALATAVGDCILRFQKS